MNGDRVRLGLCMMFPAPGIIEEIGRDWDWIWLDGQHGQLGGYEQMLAMVRACDYVGKPAYVRVAGHEASAISLALDMGADAVIVPQIDTVEQALIAVRAAKFPPLGNRSFGGRRPIDLNGREYVETANVKTKLICQIESLEAFENVSKLAALPGVDGLFLGPDDLMLRMNCSQSGEDKKRKLEEAVHTVARACQLFGKDCFCVGAGKEMMNICLLAGVGFIVAGGDAGFVAAGSKGALEMSREAMSLAIRRPVTGAGKSGLY